MARKSDRQLLHEAAQRADDMSQRHEAQTRRQVAIITRLTAENLAMRSALEAIARGKSVEEAGHIAATTLDTADALRRQTAAEAVEPQGSEPPQDRPEE